MNFASQNFRCFSFDVFDTCVTRTFAQPRDLFFRLGLVLSPPNLPTARHRRLASDFRTRRIRAEKIAYRKARPWEGATIRDIYREFHPPSWLTASVDDIMQAEIELEMGSIYAVPEIRDRIGELRASGSRIIFVSDMYLPSDVLGNILRREGLMRPEDRLYVSSEAGLTKHSGRLYQHVMSEENCAPADILHTGDNLWADVRMAKRLGLNAEHFVRASLTPHERRVSATGRSDTLTGSMLAALSRRVRLERRSMNQDADSVICGVIAPFLVSYIAWVLEAAKRAGIRRLYFVARDGEVLLRIARQLAVNSTDLDLRYLYGSRRAWLVPSLTSESRTWVRFLITPGQVCSRDAMMSRAGLSNSDRSTARKILCLSEQDWNRSLSEPEAHAALDVLLERPLTAELIFGNARKSRDIVGRYFREQGLLDNEPWATVDVGWSLNCQAALKRILSSVAGKEFVPMGFYLGLTNDHLGLEEAGRTSCFISTPGSLFSRRRVIIEHCFTPATHATTVGYEPGIDSVVPVFGPELRSSSELEFASAVQEAAVLCANIVRNEPGFYEAVTIGAPTVVSNAVRLITQPNLPEAQMLANFGTIADLRHERQFVQPLCGPLKLRDVLDVVLSTLLKGRNFKTPAFMWLEGSARLSTLPVRIVMRVLFWIDKFRFKGMAIQTQDNGA